MKPATIAKAIAAACSAGAASLTTALADGAVSSHEYALALVLAIGAGALTWRVPNRPSG